MSFRAFSVAVVTAALLALPVSGARAEIAFGVAAGDPSASDVIL